MAQHPSSRGGGRGPSKRGPGPGGKPGGGPPKRGPGPGGKPGGGARRKFEGKRPGPPGRPGGPGAPGGPRKPGPGGPASRPHPARRDDGAAAQHQAHGPDSGKPERLQKVLAHAGLGSRRECEEYIVQGRVTIDGQVAKELGTKVDLRTQVVAVDGERIKRERMVYFAVNKPKGYVSTNSDPAGRPRVIDLLPEVLERVYSVGRLDEDSTGLMILTNDGELANRLAHPKYGVEKTYRALIAGTPGRELLDRLTEGIWLSDGKVRAKRARLVGTQGEATLLELVLAEGKNREVRRMLAKLGHKVMRLNRVAIGPVVLKGLPLGEHRALSRTEIDLLRKVAAGIEVAPPRFSDAGGGHRPGRGGKRLEGPRPRREGAAPPRPPAARPGRPGPGPAAPGGKPMPGKPAGAGPRPSKPGMPGAKPMPGKPAGAGPRPSKPGMPGAKPMPGLGPMPGATGPRRPPAAAEGGPEGPRRPRKPGPPGGAPRPPAPRAAVPGPMPKAPKPAPGKAGDAGGEGPPARRIIGLDPKVAAEAGMGLSGKPPRKRPNVKRKPPRRASGIRRPGEGEG
ncbi:Ribosomal large subunit pseudouridine synthase B [Aquisphaera giovannonii]|uniref:Pseudouridine synthase n=1 Tax=Aquisphaera giovannonii TaxID=406548 RepID=A0A5B9W3G4_9BACT|nr:pseudouridine synthase [Aquisphaera giovannonii]QEH34797.1 Ribosomal large subunit pseudouridine synthase B [Aquisphaera giovannonii]